MHEVSGKWADAAGRSIALDFQALQYRDGMVTWAYADVLRNMYSGRKTCQAWAEAQKEREPLTAFAELCGVSYGEHFVPSRRQVRAGWAMSAYTRDSQQLSTLLLLCQLLCWSCSSWKHVMKEKARTMLRLLLSGTVQLSLISCQMVEHMWSDAVSFCDSSMGQTACGHFDGASFSMGEASVGMTPVERLVAHLVLVAPIAGACRACKHVLSVCVRGLAEAINGSLATMCPAKPPHKARSRTGGSKQGSRVTDTFRRFASRTARGKRVGRQGKSAARQEGLAASTFHRWVRKDMCAYWMACRRQLQPRGTLAIYEDASRLGNPAQECLVMLGYCCDSDQGCVLPTQVWRVVGLRCGARDCVCRKPSGRRRLGGLFTSPGLLGGPVDVARVQGRRFRVCRHTRRIPGVASTPLFFGNPVLFRLQRTPVASTPLSISAYAGIQLPRVDVTRFQLLAHRSSSLAGPEGLARRPVEAGEVVCRGPGSVAAPSAPLPMRPKSENEGAARQSPGEAAG